MFGDGYTDGECLYRQDSEAVYDAVDISERIKHKRVPLPPPPPLPLSLIPL